jgi:hypothetical protein
MPWKPEVAILPMFQYSAIHLSFIIELVIESNYHPYGWQLDVDRHPKNVYNPINNHLPNILTDGEREARSLIYV